MSALLAGCNSVKNSHNRPVDPSELSALVAQADRIVVSQNMLDGSKILFSSTAHKDIAEFNEAVAVSIPDRSFFCACIGTEAVRLYKGNKELVLITNHHGRTVRSSTWSSDAEIKDQEKWLRWFDARKMPGPRQEVDESNANSKQADADYKRWLDAMPQGISSVWSKATEDEIIPDHKILRTAITTELPEARQRALALFAWFGAGAGPWSGFPSYESAAEELLLDIPTPNLIAAAQTDSLSRTQLNGAARLFGGWDFSHRRPSDLNTLPDALKKKLLAHVLADANTDNQQRAKNAFER